MLTACFHWAPEGRGLEMGEGCGRCVHLSLQPRKKKKRRNRENLHLPSAQLGHHSNHSACSPTPADENLASPKCQSCSSGEKKTCERVVCAVLGKVSHFGECNRPISVYTWNPSVKSKTVLMRFPTETFPPDSLAAQLSQVDKLSSFLFSNPTQYPPFRPPAGDSRDYILAGTNLQSLLHFMNSMYRYFLIQIK